MVDFQSIPVTGLLLIFINQISKWVFLWVFVQEKLNTGDVNQRRRLNCSISPNWCDVQDWMEKNHIFYNTIFSSFALGQVLYGWDYGSVLGLVGVFSKEMTRLFFNLFLDLLSRIKAIFCGLMLIMATLRN